MNHLRGSVEENPRPVWLIYANPLFEEIVLKTALFNKIAGTHQYSIFRADSGIQD
jgi:hypothetical protein